MFTGLVVALIAYFFIYRPAEEADAWVVTGIGIFIIFVGAIAAANNVDQFIRLRHMKKHGIIQDKKADEVTRLPTRRNGG